MANPNPEVYGTSETWADCAIFYTVGSGDIATRTIKPQIQVWDSASLAERKGTLSRAITAGKLTAGIPIDATICPCGQDPTASCFGNIGLFKNHSDSDANKIPDRIVSFIDPVNWFFSEIWRYYPDARAFRPQLADRVSDLCRWSPNGNLTDLYNQNRYVTPFVYYQLKSIFANIYVNTITGYDNAGRPNHGQMTLEEWKNNYPTRKIDSAVLRLKGVTSQTGGTIAYTGGNLDDYRSVGVSLLNDIDGIVDYYTYYEDRRQYVRLFGDLSANAFNTTDTYYMLAYDMFENVEVKSVFESGQTQGGWSVWQEIPYSETNYEKILQMAACFGIPFSPTSKETFAAEFTDNDLYLPVIDEDGIAHGEYTRGLRNVSNSLYDMDGIRDIDYDPSKNVDPNTYSNVTGFNTVTTNAALTKRYVLDAANVEKLADDLWTICSELSSSDFEHFEGKLKDEFLTQNPIDCIISLQRFPFQIPGLGTKAPIRLGKSTGSAQGYTTYFIFNTILFSGKQIFPRFGNCFLDYEPYTSYEIYVPFCGTRKLRAEDLIGHTVNVHMQIDLITGSCTAYIMADQLVIETLNGSCAVDQQLSGAQTATMNANIFNGILAQKQTDKIEGYNIAKTWLPGNWVSDLMDPMGNAMRMSNAKYEAQKANYDITHVQVPPHKIGSASPLLSWYQEFDARIIIYYPEGDVINSAIPPTLNEGALATFGHLKGFGTVSPGTVSQFRGDVTKSWYLQGDIIAEGIPCTDSERKRIKSMFAAGVYI